MDFKEAAFKHALKNRVDFGKASEGSVMGKVIAELHPEKSEMKEVAEAVRSAVKEANEFSDEKAREQVSLYSFSEKKVEERKLSLPGVEEGKVVTRFLPEPNGYGHLGHAKSALLSIELARVWKGKCFLRWDDTNPEKESQEYVDAIRSDLKWLFGEKAFEGEGFASDLIPQFYFYAAQLISQGDAFACTCKKEEISESRKEHRECPCRSTSIEDNLTSWKKMTSGKMKHGEAILRLKGDMKSLNTVMRDPALFRVLFASHYRQKAKYFAWPTYDFEACIADSLNGVTHALRSKEYELRDELYYAILDKLKLRKPLVYDFARLNIRGTALSKRLLKPLIETGKVNGWDDPRLPTLRGLKRRGILPEAIKSFVMGFGLSKVDSEPSWEPLLSENRKLVDPIAERRFFVDSPMLVTLENEMVQEVSLKKHPKEDKGFRKFKLGKEFFISKTDFDSLKEGEEFRFKDLGFNCVVRRKKYTVLECSSHETSQIPEKKIHWVSALDGEFIPAEIWLVNELLDENGNFNEKSLEVKKGYCERSCLDLTERQHVQFERVGYFVLDSKEKIRFIQSC